MPQKEIYTKHIYTLQEFRLNPLLAVKLHVTLQVFATEKLNLFLVLHMSVQVFSSRSNCQISP